MHLGKKSPKFFPAGPFFLVLQLNVYRSALILRNLPCPDKFLLTRLSFWPSCYSWYFRFHKQLFADDSQNRCSFNLVKLTEKNLSQSLCFNEAADLQAEILIWETLKRTLQTFKNSYFIEHLQVNTNYSHSSFMLSSKDYGIYCKK